MASSTPRIWPLPFTRTSTKRRAEAIKIKDDYISHYGVKRRSGRYPWGSGEDPFQRGSENTVNAIARGLANRDLAGASKLLGISNVKISEGASNIDYARTKNMLFSKIEGRHINMPDDVLEKLPDNVKWDAEKGCWSAVATTAYWDQGNGRWITVEGKDRGQTNPGIPEPRIYYSDANDRWVNEKGENVAKISMKPDNQGNRYIPDGIPWNATWNPEEERWELNTVVPPSRKWNEQKKTWETVVWNEQKKTWEPAEWNPETNSYEPKEKSIKIWNKKTEKWDVFEWNPETNSYEPKEKSLYEWNPETKIYEPKRDGWFKSLRSAVKNMGEFFKRKMSEIINKFDD